MAHQQRVAFMKNKRKSKGNPGPAQSRKTSLGYAGVPTGSVTANAVASVYRSGILVSKEPDAVSQLHQWSLGDKLYRNTYFLMLKEPGAANVFQTKFLEPLLNQYFTTTSGDKLDTTARQNFMDLVLKCWDLLHVLHTMWTIGTLCPTITRSDITYGVPMTRTSWESFMQMLETSDLMIPVLAINLAKLTSWCTQIGPGNIASRGRPSYLINCTPHRALTGAVAGTTWPAELDVFTGSLESLVDSILGEYDAKLYASQSVLPCIKFNRTMVEGLSIIHTVSNLQEAMGFCMPFANDVGGAETEYAINYDSNTDLSYTPEYGPPNDFLAAFVMYRLTDAAPGVTYGGIWHKQAMTNDHMSLMAIDIQVGTSFAEIAPADIKDGTFVSIQGFYMLNGAAAAGDYTNWWACAAAKHAKILVNPFTSETAWNQRWAAWAIQAHIITQPLRLKHVGFVPSYDILVSPPPRMDNTAAISLDHQRNYENALWVVNNTYPTWFTMDKINQAKATINDRRNR